MKVKKENVVSCGKKNQTQREIELQFDIVSLKRQIGGMKTSNANYRKQVEELKKELEMANLTNDELRGQIASYNNQILDYNDRISGLKQEIEDLRAVIEHERKPWWKKLF